MAKEGVGVRNTRHSVGTRHVLRLGPEATKQVAAFVVHTHAQRFVQGTRESPEGDVCRVSNPKFPFGRLSHAGSKTASFPPSILNPLDPVLVLRVGFPLPPRPPVSRQVPSP